MKRSLAIAALLFNTAAFGQGTSFHIQKVFHIGGANSWDYIAVCPVNDNIYVSHGTQVNILNKNTGDSVGIIPNTLGVHGIAFAPTMNKGFTSNGKMNTVTVFDIATNAVLAQINTGENPDAIMYDPYSMKVYVCDGRSKDLCVIDPSTNAVIKTVALDGKPETAVADERNIYINIEDKNEIEVVSSKTYEVLHHWKLGKGESPSGLAMDVKTHRLFAGCENKMLVVMNAENGKVMTTLPIGDGCDGVAFNPATSEIFSANGEGNVTLLYEVNDKKFEMQGQIPTNRGARTLALDLKTDILYLPTANTERTDEPGKHPHTIPGTFEVISIGK